MYSISRFKYTILIVYIRIYILQSVPYSTMPQRWSPSTRTAVGYTWSPGGRCAITTGIIYM